MKDRKIIANNRFSCNLSSVNINLSFGLHAEKLEIKSAQKLVVGNIVVCDSNQHYTYTTFENDRSEPSNFGSHLFMLAEMEYVILSNEMTFNHLKITYT